MPRKDGWGKKQFRSAFIVAFVALACVGAYLGYEYYQSTSAIAPAPTTPTVTAPTTITGNFPDYCTGEALEPDVSIYEVDASESTLDEIEEFVVSDFDLAHTDDEDFELEPEAGYDYFLVINLTGYITESYYYYTVGAPAEDVGYPLVLGVNTIYLMNITEAVDVLAYNSTLGTSFHLEDGTGFVANWTCDDPDWTLILKPDYDEAGSAVDAAEGLKLAYDFENGWWNRTVVKVEFNTTALASYAKIGDYTNHEVCVGNVTYIGIDKTVVGETDTLDLKFSSGIGTDYYVRSLSLCYGDYAGTPRIFATLSGE